MDDPLFCATNTRPGEPLTTEKLRAACEKLATQQPGSDYEIVSPGEYKRRVRSYLRDANRQN